eukprot:UN07611
METLNVNDWTHQMQINDSLDVFDETPSIKSWCIGKICDINDTQIKIHFYGWTQPFDEWIDKNNCKRLAPLNTYTVSCKVLSNPLRFPDIGILYQKDDNKCIILNIHQL